MKRWGFSLLLTAAAGIWIASGGLGPQSALAWPDEKGDASEPMLGHMVFFTLQDSNAENRQKLVNACLKYLGDHDGTVHFSVGTVADLDRPVNVRDFDVALHLVFKDRASHDQYQTHSRHQKFIEENSSTWSQVRVFDSDIAAQ